MTRIASFLTVATLALAAPFAASAESVDAQNDPTIEAAPARGALIETTRGAGLFGAFDGSNVSYVPEIKAHDLR